LSNAAQGMEISDGYAGLLAVELVKLGNQLLADQAAAPERWQCLREILGQLSHLRRDDHRALRTRTDRERWLRQVETEDAANAERARQKERDKELAPYYGAMEFDLNAEAFDGGHVSRAAAAGVLETELDLPPGTLDELVDGLGGASASRAEASERRPERRLASRPDLPRQSQAPADLPRCSLLAKAGASGSEFRLQPLLNRPAQSPKPCLNHTQSN
jgi:hypothetical protein